MTKFHSLLLALAVSFSMYSQTTLSFSACTTANLSNSLLDITSDTNNIVYMVQGVTTNVSGLMKSTDNGDNFSIISLNSPNEIIALGTPSNVILFGKYKKSIDNGLNWINHTDFGTTNVQRFVKINNLTAYCFDHTTCYKTTNGGASWQTQVFNQNNIYYNSILNVPYLGTKDEIYFNVYDFSSSSNNLMKSNDIGATFTQTLALNNNEIISSTFPNFNTGNTFYAFTYNTQSSNVNNIREFNVLNSNNLPNNSVITYSVHNYPFYNTAKFRKSTIANNHLIVIDSKLQQTGEPNKILRMLLPTPTNTTVINSINELSNAKINLYPNPCVNQLTIESLQSELNYIVTNQLGQVMLQGFTRGIVNTTNLTPGVYYLTLNQTRFSKFIKE